MVFHILRYLDAKLTAILIDAALSFQWAKQAMTFLAVFVSFWPRGCGCSESLSQAGYPYAIGQMFWYWLVLPIVESSASWIADQVERHDGFSLNRECHADTVPPNVLKFLGQKFRHWSILADL